VDPRRESTLPPTDSQHGRSRILDPVLVHARHETIIIFVVFGLCFLWSVTWCYSTGYGLPADQPVAKVFGVPSWIFWGVIVPWLLADGFSIWFCLSYMALDPLGEGTGPPVDGVTSPPGLSGQPPADGLPDDGEAS